MGCAPSAVVATVAASGLTDCGAAALSSTCECKKSNLPVILHNARTNTRERIFVNSVGVINVPSLSPASVEDCFTKQSAQTPSCAGFFHRSENSFAVRPSDRWAARALLTFGVGRSVCDGGSRRLTALLALLAASVRPSVFSLCVCCCFCSVSFRPPVAMRRPRPPLPSPVLSPVPSADRRLNDLSFFVPAFLRPPSDGNEAVDPIKNARNKRGSLSKLSRS